MKGAIMIHSSLHLAVSLLAFLRPVVHMAGIDVHDVAAVGLGFLKIIAVTRSQPPCPGHDGPALAVVHPVAISRITPHFHPRPLDIAEIPEPIVAIPSALYGRPVKSAF